MCRVEACCLPLFPSTNMPSHQHQLAQPMRPRLPRKLTTSARINLNKYWQVLEELMPTRKALDETDSNAINENIDNEQRLAAMQLSADTVLAKSRTPSPVPTPEISTASSSSAGSFIPMSVDVDSSSADENTPPSSLSGHSPSR